MTQLKKKKPVQKPSRKSHSGTTPLLVYFTAGLGGMLGMTLGMLVFVHQMLLHFVPILPLGAAGYFIGKWIYKLRGYEDIM